MADMVDDYPGAGQVKFVDDAVVSNAAPQGSFRASQFYIGRGTGSISWLFYSSEDVAYSGGG